jgi:hypothetical protein
LQRFALDQLKRFHSIRQSLGAQEFGAFKSRCKKAPRKMIELSDGQFSVVARIASYGPVGNVLGGGAGGLLQSPAKRFIAPSLKRRSKARLHPHSGFAGNKKPTFRWVHIDAPTAIVRGRSHQPCGG